MKRVLPLLLVCLLASGAWAIPEFPPASGGGAPVTSSYVTIGNETATLTGSRRLISGTNTTVVLGVGTIQVDSVAGTAATLPTATLVAAGSAVVGFTFCDATGGSFSALLPTAVGNVGKLVDLKKVDGTVNSVTVSPVGVQTIDGAVSYVLGSENQAVSLISDGSNWKVR